MTPLLTRPYERFGDKQNSDFFEDFLPKLYDWRDSVGLPEMIKEMHSVVIEVDEEDRHAYLEEISLMTPYSYKTSYESETFVYSLMEIDEDSPGYIIRSRKNPDCSAIHSMNMFAPVAMKKPFTRYIGEVYRVTDIEKVHDLLSQAGTTFQKDGIIDNSQIKYVRTAPSQYTWNTVGYIEYPEGDRRYYCEQFEAHEEPAELIEKLKTAKEQQKALNISDLILPIDHLATRVFHQDREHAILEYLKLTSYYYWGSYDIADQNSSTNVTRNAYDWAESKSPARVFTAANTPHYLDHIVQLPSPTEAFVKNYGRRMHHIAYSVADNAEGQTEDNIDVVVDQLKEQGVQFLLKVIGSKEEGIKQIFSRTSKLSHLITEYVQRYDGFQGFFTKKNVAFLTQSAGEDESIKKDVRIGESDLCD